MLGIKKSKIKKISMSLSKAEEKRLDNDIEKNDKMSIVVMGAILVLCFVVGISLGYLLYRIAINGSI
jgi:hypothetical protein